MSEIEGSWLPPKCISVQNTQRGKIFIPLRMRLLETDNGYELKVREKCNNNNNNNNNKNNSI
jgi:hypothetical protein